MRRHPLLFLALTIAAGCLTNAALFTLASSLGYLDGRVVRTTMGMPISLGAVLVATTIGAAAAVAVRVALAWLVRPPRRARRLFLVVALATLAGSFVSPVSGITGATTVDVVVLEVMHVVAAIAATIAGEWAARPRWDFGEANYDARRIVPPVAVVTGATSGIGASAATELARRGYRVLGIGRDAARARAVEATHGGISIVLGDLGSIRDALRLATVLEATIGAGGVGLLIHCAGTLAPAAGTTPDGIDVNFATSFLGRFVLTERLRLAPTCRIVNVSAAEQGHVPRSLRSPLTRAEDIGTGLRAHGQAQLANDLWVAHLASEGWQAYGYGPGAVDTRIRRHLPRLLRVLMRPLFAVDTRQPSDAARDILRLAFDPTLPPHGFASRDGLFEHDAFIYDTARQRALVQLARDLVAATEETSRT